ncbi:MAG: TonB-dependent receptor [Rickettsiales bacterium]|nr:TonB-dependent receptor [Rickettsiales bacterium]
MKKILTLTLTKIITCAVLPQAHAQSLDYAMMGALFKEPVTTSANGSPQRSRDVPLNMEILTRSDIQKLGVRTIPEALRFIPGVSVNQITYGQTEVAIRGYNQSSSERILVLVNGRQVYQEFYGRVNWGNIPVEIGEIEQIEVVKGPNTALFGFNATSGVINIVTTNPLYNDHNELTVRGGSHSLREVSLVMNQKINDKVAIKLSSGGFTTNEDFGDAEEVRRYETITPERRSAAMDVWMQLTDHTQAHFEFTKNQYHANETTLQIIPSPNSAIARQDAASSRARLLSDTDFGMIEADIYHNTSLEEYSLDFVFFGGLNNVTPVSIDNHLTVAKLNNTFELGKNHIFRIGGEYRQASSFVSSNTPVDADDLSYEIYSGTALWNWSATDKLTTSIAVRYDDFTLEPDSTFVSPNILQTYAALGRTPPFSDADYFQERKEFSYNIGAVYQLDAINTFRASTARGIDLPNFYEFGYQAVIPDIDQDPFNPLFDTEVSVGNPHMDTAVITNYELGYERKIGTINGQFKSAIFFQNSEDMQYFNVTNSDGFAVNESIGGNIGDSQMYGIELGLDGTFKNHWHWHANYTYLNIEDDFNNQQSSVFPYSSGINFEDSVVNHVFNASIGYQKDAFHSNLLMQYRSDFEDLVTVQLPPSSTGFGLKEADDQFIINSTILYNINDKVDWQLSAANIVGQTEQFVDYDSEVIVWSSVSIKF